MKKLRLNIKGKDVEVQAQKIGGVLWFHYQGDTYQYTPELQKSTESGGGQQDPSRILAPMPGKIIKILKSVGDTAQEGETVIAMEAMKMEYNLKASQDRVVADICCHEGQTVALGDVLVKLEEKDG